MTKQNKNILVLPRWYPNKTDIQLGIFIQRQLVLMQDEFNFTVVYAQGVDDLESKHETVTSRKHHGFTEHIVYFKNGKGPFKKLINFLRYRKSQKLGLEKFENRIDLCHVHVPYRSGMPAIELKKKKGVPFLITEHWSGHLNGQYLKKNAIDKMLYKRFVKKAAGISTVSEALQRAFKDNTGFDSIHIPNYIESCSIESCSIESEKKEKKYIEILSVCDFHDKTKNISGMIGAFVMAHHLNPKLRLTLIGGGPDEDKIRELVKQVRNIGIPEGAICLTGRQKHHHVLKAMNKCDFYLCNSNYETFGMTVAEALLAGKPIISTKCGGPEEFLDATNSILISLKTQRQVDNLAEAMITMSKTFQNYDSTKISKEIETKFGKNAVRKKWLDFYSI